MKTTTLRRLYLSTFEANSRLSAIAFRRAIRKDVQELNPQTLAHLNFLQTSNLERSLVDRFEKNGIKYGNTIYNDLRMQMPQKRFNPLFSESWARFVNNNYASRLGTKIVLLQGTIKEEVSRMVSKTIAESDTIVDLREAIQKVVNSNSFYAWQAERIARTEVGNALNQASEVAVNELGIEVRKRWVASLDGRERDSHRALNGVEIEKNDVFDNGMSYPHDPNGEAEEVINCRCVVQYIPKN